VEGKSFWEKFRKRSCDLCGNTMWHLLVESGETQKISYIAWRDTENFSLECWDKYRKTRKSKDRTLEERYRKNTENIILRVVPWRNAGKI